MHVTREMLKLAAAFFAGGMAGMIWGIGLLVAWLKGWIFPISLPSNEKAVPPEPGWADHYRLMRDELGNITYTEKPPYAGDGEG